MQMNRRQFPSAQGSGAGRPYRVAIRVIKERQLREGDDGGVGDDGASSPLSSALRGGGNNNNATASNNNNNNTASSNATNSFKSPAKNSVGSASSERLLSHLPHNFCSVWHPHVCNNLFQLGEMSSAGMSQGCGLYVIDCGYEEQSVGLNDDLLAHYIRHSTFVPAQGLRSLIGGGGIGGIGPSFGISGGGGAGDDGGGGGSSGGGGAKANSGEGVAVAFLTKLLSERPGHTVQFSFFAMSGVDRPITDLLLPLMPVSHAATVAGTLDERSTGTLSSLVIGSLEEFTKVLTNVTSSNSFRLARPRLSFGLVFKSHNVPHVMLLLNQQHQRLAIAVMEGQTDALPPPLRERLREADAANNRMGAGASGAKMGGGGHPLSTTGFANVFDPTRQSGVADFYGSGSRIQHDPPPAAGGAAGITGGQGGTFFRDSGDGLSSLGAAFSSTNNNTTSTNQPPINHEQLKAIQQRRLLAVNVLAQIRRTMALHYMKEQRVEFFKPMYVVRIGGEQRGRDPLGMIPFLLARGSPNTLLGADGADYRVLMNTIGGGGGGGPVGMFGESSPWNGGGGGGQGSVAGGLDQHQYAMLMAGLSPQQQQAQRGRVLQDQQRQYQQELLHYQQQLQAAAATAGLDGSVLMFKPPMAPPTEDNIFGNLNTTNPSSPGRGMAAMMGSSSSSPMLNPQRSLFNDYNVQFMRSEATNPTMMLVPNGALPPALQQQQMQFSQMGVGAGGGMMGGGVASQQRFQHQPPASSPFLNNNNLSSSSGFYGGKGMGGYHHNGLYDGSGGAGYNNGLGSNAMPHLSRMAQSPTQLPYALLQHPSNHPHTAAAVNAQPLSPTALSTPASPMTGRAANNGTAASLANAARNNTNAKGIRGAGGGGGAASSADADRVIAQFEMVSQEPGETLESAMYRSEKGIPGDTATAAAAANIVGPITTSVVAPPAVKPFMVTDATIEDTFEYLEKEKHVCRNAHRELQKDIHSILKHIEEITRRHENMREAMKRRREEMGRLKKECEGSAIRTEQTAVMVDALDKEIKAAKEAAVFEEDTKHSYAEEDANKEKERSLKKAAFAEKVSVLSEEHRQKMAKEAAATEREEDKLRSEMASLKRAMETSNAVAQRELIGLDGEMTLVGDSMTEKASEIRTLSEKVAEMTAKRRQLEISIERLRHVAAEESQTISSHEKQLMETAAVKERVAGLEKSLAAYDYFMTEEANRLAEEVGAVVDKMNPPQPQLHSRQQQTSRAASSAAPTTLSLRFGGSAPPPTPPPQGASMSSVIGGGHQQHHQRRASLLDELLGLQTQQQHGATAASAEDDLLQNHRSVSAVMMGEPHTNHASAGGHHYQQKQQQQQQRYTEADAAVVSSRIGALFTLRRSAATLKAQTVKQRRTLALRRARLNKYRLLARVEEAEGAARRALMADWAHLFAADIAAAYPQSYAKAHRMHEMFMADSITNNANSNSSDARNGNTNINMNVGGGALKSSLRGSSTPPGGGSSPNSRRIRFVDIDTDLASVSYRLATLRTEVQGKVRRRLDLVTQLEACRNDASALAADSTARSMDEALKHEIEGVARLKTAQKQVFDQQEEELQRRRRVYMSMFLEFLPQIKKEVAMYEAQRSILQQQKGGGGGGGGTTPSGTPLLLSKGGVASTVMGVKAIVGNAAAAAKAEGGGAGGYPAGMNVSSTAGGGGGGAPRYARDTASFTAHRRPSALLSAGGGGGLADEVLRGEGGHVRFTVAETVRSNSSAVTAADGGAVGPVVNAADTPTPPLAGSGGGGVGALGLPSSLNLTNLPTAAADATNRFAAMAVKHLHGHHTRSGTNPLGISGQANITVEHGDTACQLYHKWREVLGDGKRLFGLVEERSEEAAAAEEKVASLGDRVKTLRDRLGALSEQRQQFEAEKRRHLKHLSDATLHTTEADIEKDSEGNIARRVHHQRMAELKRSLASTQSLAAAVANEVALNTRDSEALRREVATVSEEVNALPMLLVQRDKLKTTNALIESQLLAQQEEAARREARQQQGGGLSSVLLNAASPIPNHRDHPSIIKGGHATNAVIDIDGSRFVDAQHLSPYRRRAYAGAFEPRHDAIPSATEVAAAVEEAEAEEEGARMETRVNNPKSSSSSAPSSLPKGILERIASHKARQRELQSALSRSASNVSNVSLQHERSPSSAADGVGNGRRAAAAAAAAADGNDLSSSIDGDGEVVGVADLGLRRHIGGAGAAGGGGLRGRNPSVASSLRSTASSSAAAADYVDDRHNTNNKATRLEKLLSRLEHSEARADRSVAKADAFLRRNADKLADDGGLLLDGANASHHYGDATRDDVTNSETATSSPSVPRHQHDFHEHYSLSPGRVRRPDMGANGDVSAVTMNNTSVANATTPFVSKYADLRSVLSQHISALGGDE